MLRFLRAFWLSFCVFQNPEPRNEGVVTERLSQLKLFIHQQSWTIRLYCFFGENLSEFETAWKVIGQLLELLQNVMEQGDVAFEQPLSDFRTGLLT